MSPNDPLPILRPRRYLLPTLSSCWLMLLPPSPKLLEGPLSLLAPLPAAASRSRSPPPLLFSPLSCFEDPPYPRNLLLLFVDCSLLPRIPNLLLAPPLLLLFSFEAADAEPLSVRTTPTKLFCADKLSGMNYTRWRRPSVVLPVVLPSRARLKASNATEFSVPIQQKNVPSGQSSLRTESAPLHAPPHWPARLVASQKTLLCPRLTHRAPTLERVSACGKAAIAWASLGQRMQCGGLHAHRGPRVRVASQESKKGQLGALSLQLAVTRPSTPLERFSLLARLAKPTPKKDLPSPSPLQKRRA
mmetsp:Transcript_9729/g.24974  ORF Transcript_9729/g.24974 Transcript_9729/m.24974 type:complete len:302 (+) Transcript_9729:1108-2013(+)